MIQTFLRLLTIARDNTPLPAYPQNPHSPGLFPSCLLHGFCSSS